MSGLPRPSGQPPLVRFAPAPDYMQLGPDPEPIGHRLPAARRCRSPRDTLSRRCVLQAAVGEQAPCLRERCAFYRFRGRSGCAVLRWLPDIEHDPELAFRLLPDR